MKWMTLRENIESFAKGYYHSSSKGMLHLCTVLQTYFILCWLANEWGWLWKPCLIAYPFNIYNLTFWVLLESQTNANSREQTPSSQHLMVIHFAQALKILKGYDICSGREEFILQKGFANETPWGDILNENTLKRIRNYSNYRGQSEISFASPSLLFPG